MTGQIERYKRRLERLQAMHHKDQAVHEEIAWLKASINHALFKTASIREIKP